ncbi:MAG: hypothetical protein E7371_05035 [Clostridiales bacterium]|nr:hypothetical protein [Clostridiales bacterium]
MKKNILNKMFALAFAAAFLTPTVNIQTASADGKMDVIRDYSQYASTANFMVGGFFAPDLTNPAEVAMLQNSGLDFICLNGNNTVTNWSGLGQIFDDFEQNGMKILLDANKGSNPDAIGSWSEALGCYVSGWSRDCVIGTDIWDEPINTVQIDQIATYIEAFEGAFAGKQFFANLMPNYYWSETFTNDYASYVEYYADTVLDHLTGPKMLSVDSYPLRRVYGGTKNYITTSFLSDLATTAVIAKQHGADVSYYAQTMNPAQNSTYKPSYRNLEGQADVDMQYSIFMAFGAKQIINFCYETPALEDAFLSEAMVKADGTPTANYTYVQNAIKNIDAMDEAYMNFDWNGVIISKGTAYDRFAAANNNNKDCYGQLTNALFANEIAYANSYSERQKQNLTKGNLNAVTSTETTLVGCFEDDMGYNGYYLANANDSTRNTTSSVTMNFYGNTDKVRVYRGTGYTDETLSGNSLTLNMSSGEGIFVVPFKAEDGYTVTMNANGAVENTVVAKGGSFVLPEKTVDGELFLGWETNGKVYPAGYIVSNVSSDMTLTAVTLDMDMRVGASVRIANDYENSIRWTADVDKNSLSAVESAVGADNLHYGVTVISSAEEGSLTIDISKEKFGYSGNAWTISGVLTKVPDEQLNTIFEGRAFVKVTFADGTQKKFYANGNDNARSIAQVAYRAYNDPNGGYTADQMKRLLVLSLPYTESTDNNGSLNDWIAGLDKDNFGSLEDWLLIVG